MTITIDKDIPMPPSTTGSITRYPFRSMEIGDSFFVPKAKFSLHHVYSQRYGTKYSARTVTENGVKGKRIWRTK